MRIKCNPEDCQSKNSSCEAVDYQTLGISRMRNQNISTEIIGDLEPGVTPFISPIEPKMSSYVPKDKLPKQNFTDDSQLDMKSFKPASLEFKRNYSQPAFRKNSLDMAGEYGRDFIAENQGAIRFYSPVESSSTDEIDGNFIGGNVILGKYDNKIVKDTLLPSFTNFSHNNNNENNSNNNNNDSNMNKSEPTERSQREEIVKEDADSSNEAVGKSILKGKPYALATLDGTIMLVEDEVILW